MYIQWYPGHMTKAKRMIEENLKLIDVVVEIVDARVPISSRNPDVNEITKNKDRVIVLNKVDLADENSTKDWEEYFVKKGYSVVLANGKSGKGVKDIIKAIDIACESKLLRMKRRGIKKPLRAMVIGIPNVGKSTIINKLVGRASAKTGNKPGVTKGKQWLKIKNKIELLDTPGVLWPKFDDEQIGINLAMIGSIKDEIVEGRRLGIKIIEFLKENSRILDDLSNKNTDDMYEVFLDIGKNKNFITKGGEIDEARTAKFLMEQFRNGKFGRFTLECVDE